MFTCCFIDWENIEKSAEQEFGSVLNFDALAAVIRQVAEANGNKLVGIKAYGDFDRGQAGLQTSLVLLGIEPHHVVTKTEAEYLKGSVDIELALDVMETSYTLPHIQDFVFVGEDRDFLHVMRRLRKQGKNIRLLTWRRITNPSFFDSVDEAIDLEEFPSVLKKVSLSERERRYKEMEQNPFVTKIVVQLYRMEEKQDRTFVGLNLLRTKLVDKTPDKMTLISDALTDCLNNGLIEKYGVENPNDSLNPTTACRLNRENPLVLKILREELRLSC